ncbi:MAG: c-type cytochrome [Alphaproteobacteria bacterium]
MSGLELNKIAASILLAGLIAMVVGKITDILYRPNIHIEKRGFQIAVEENDTAVDTDANSKEEIVKIGQLLAKADENLGKQNAQKCVICHNFDKNGPNKIGPDLWNIVNSPKAHHSGYTYSEAMANKGGNWTYEELYHFLASPKKFIPGTKMGFAGFKKPEDISNTIMYLRSLSDSPQALPPIEQ